jgi:hypothetical protein
MPEFAPVINLASLDGSNGFRLDGTAGNRSGESVDSAGDVNGDGFDDLVIGAPFGGSPGFSAAGKAYVVFGMASGFAAGLALSSLDGSNGFQISGEAALDLSGNAVSSAGDVNGDGFADLLIGASSANPNGDGSGASYVVFGKASGFPADLALSSLDGSNGFQISGEAIGDYSGYAVSSAGDVNGDGFADLLIGARAADPNGDQSGSSYVVFGKATDFPAEFDLGSLDVSDGFRLNGVHRFGFSGYSVSSAGDVNGDGFGDILIGAPEANSQQGESFLVFGKASGFAASLDLANLDGQNGFRLVGIHRFDSSGCSVSSAGDVNGDGFDDLLIGARFADPGGVSESGETYVVFGHRALIGVVRVGTAIAQSINGGFGNDTIDGLGGNDRLIGWEGNDTIAAGTGDDILDGGDGRDTASYASATAGVTVDLSGLNPQNTVGAGTDSLAGIENLTGSAFADSLTGDSGANVLAGGGQNDVYNDVDATDTIVELLSQGNDTVNTALASYKLPANVERVNFTGVGNFVGTGNAGDNRFAGGAGNDRFVDVFGGADIFSGGSGIDSVDFRTSTTGAILDLITSVHSGAAAGDTYVGMEKYLGSASAGDTMTAGAERAVFAGYGGDDVLSGGVKNDQLLGGADNDTLIGNGDRDSLNGGAGDDTMTGGSHGDVFVFTDAAFGQDTITDYQDGLDHLKVFSAVADDIADFAIANNGTNTVTLTLIADNSNTITIQGAAPITITAADFVFY